MYDFELRERADEDLAAAEYDRLYHGFPVMEYWDDDFVRFVARSWSEGDRVLDLGCATASLWGRWHELPEPSRLVGIDISEEMISQARRKYPGGEFDVARVHDLPFEAGSFDVVIASSVLHHVPDSHLDEAFQEIVRVLDEHGRLIGRDASHNTFARDPGWFSGALMGFRHLTYRLTRSREYPEPALGEHHHVFDPDAFQQIASRHLTLTAIEQRFPFSCFLPRIRDERLARLARRLDELAAHRGGSMIYYVGEKNYVPASEVSRAIALAREEVEPVSDAEFLAYLQAATIEIARVFNESGYVGEAGNSS